MTTGNRQPALGNRKNLKLGSLGLCATLFALSIPAGAQQSKKVHLIGILRNDTPTLFASRNQALRQGLHELGYVDGENIRFEYRYAERNLNRLPELAAELVGLKVDVIVVGGGTTSVARKATTTIPIVVGSAGDLVGGGHVASLARPGGNVTGSTDISPDLSGKRREVLRDILPKAARVAVLSSGSKSDLDEVRQTEAAAPHLGLKVNGITVRNRNEFAGAYEKINKQQANAIIFIQSGETLPHRKELSELAARHRLPSMCETSVWTEDGCMMNYGPDLLYLWRRAATYVDKILKGAKPGELPVEQPTKFEMVINLQSAKRIGVTIPPNVLARADRVIK
jgi:putative tryptophan/tyrosine transport system substrate-binding protein